MADRLAENLASIRARMAVAAERSNRPADAITLVGVTKYAGVELARALLEAGCEDLGESRPQELWEKAETLAAHDPPPRWHVIGHLQRNKIDRTVAIAQLIHSVDSVRLIRALNAAGEKRSAPIDVLLEVNISGDLAKHGFWPAQMNALADELRACPQVRVRGLMAMSGLKSKPAAVRHEFSRLRELRDRLRSDWGEDYLLDDLSMGMSDDFEIAIEEGATMVRIGSALVEGVEID